MLQVGYMKRFDPSYEAACRLIAGKGERLRYLSVEVNDPDAGPFVGHHPLIAATDIPPRSSRRRPSGGARRSRRRSALHQHRSWRAALPSRSAPRWSMTSMRCMACSTPWNSPPGPVRGAAIFAGGAGSQATVELRDGEALWTMTHVEIPGVGDYRERITLYFEDEIVELVFPAPYLNHHPTELSVRRAAGGDLETIEIRSGFREPFVMELESFWSAIVEGTPQRNPISEARRDQALLVAMARTAADLPPVLQ